MNKFADLPLRTVNKLLTIWKSNPNKEVCGVLVGDCYRVVQCDNVATNPEGEYEFNTEELSKLYRAHKVVGIWHTHPRGYSPEPSEADCQDAKGRKERHFVVSESAVVEVM